MKTAARNEKHERNNLALYKYFHYPYVRIVTNENAVPFTDHSVTTVSDPLNVLVARS